MSADISDEERRASKERVPDIRRKCGAVLMAHALSWGTRDEADRADAKAIAADAVHVLGARLAGFCLPMMPDHIEGAAQFFRQLADALYEHAVKAKSERESS